MEEKKGPTSLGQWISNGAIILLSIVCVLLTLQNRDLKRMLSSTTAMGNVEPLKEGDKVEPFKITTLDGNDNELNYNDPTRRHLLFVFSTTCPHCEKTVPVWNAVTKFKNDDCDIIGVSIHSLDDTKKYIISKSVDFYAVSAMKDTSFSRKYKIYGVPETILIDGRGIVEKAWLGELNEGHEKEIEKLMNAPRSLSN